MLFQTNDVTFFALALKAHLRFYSIVITPKMALTMLVVVFSAMIGTMSSISMVVKRVARSRKHAWSMT